MWGLTADLTTTQVQNSKGERNKFQHGKQKQKCCPRKRKNADLVRSVQLFLSFDQFFLLVREVDKLVQSFLVHMTVPLELHVTLLQLLEELHKDTSTCSNLHKLAWFVSSMAHFLNSCTTAHPLLHCVETAMITG